MGLEMAVTVGRKLLQMREINGVSNEIIWPHAIRPQPKGARAENFDASATFTNSHWQASAASLSIFTL
jgi:hypothetical protein